MIFDNSKIKKLVPEFNPQISFVKSSQEIMDWADRTPIPQVVDERGQ